MKRKCLPVASLMAAGSILLSGLTVADGAETPINPKTSTSSTISRRVATEIRAEATRANNDAEGRPLPLFSHWNAGTHPSVIGFNPTYQMQLIENGHHVLPVFAFPNISSDAAPRAAYDPSPEWNAYYEIPLKQAAKSGLPITLMGTQWERLLSDDKAYFDLPADQNPNVVTPDGKVLNKVSPFGPVELWREVGRKWGSTPLMQQLQKWYPNPPLVILLSNNEHRKLTWDTIEEDARYLKLYGKDRDDNFKRKVIAESWIERYKALQDGIRQALISPQWQKNALFVGYNAFGPSHFGRWDGWLKYSLYTPGRMDPDPLYWDGGSPSYYAAPYANMTDFRVMSPQIEFMNYIFMQQEAQRLNPHFWFEMSVWDGALIAESAKEKHNDPAKDTTALYRSLGQIYNPSRYNGYTQFGMWLTRPRVVREYRNWDDSLDAMEPYFMPLVESVDHIYSSAVLRDFWRHGTLVANHTAQHPYQSVIPDELKNVDRWFLLDTNLTPPRPWTLKTEIPVFALALVKGEKTSRQWLIYAHSPLQERQDVEVTVPEYGPVRLDVPVAGAFYLVDEKTKQVRPVP